MRGGHRTYGPSGFQNEITDQGTEAVTVAGGAVVFCYLI